jgi:hypothetical protein
MSLSLSLSRERVCVGSSSMSLRGVLEQPSVSNMFLRRNVPSLIFVFCSRIQNVKFQNLLTMAAAGLFLVIECYYYNNNKRGTSNRRSSISPAIFMV